MSIPPNIILIMPDQYRGDCLGIEGSHPVLTPNLDSLATEGARFSRAYSTAPVCMPARRSLLSGQSPATHGLLGNAAGLEWDIQQTLPFLLRDAGYQTMLVGRSMHQYPVRKRFGFDEMLTEHDYFAWLSRQLPVDTEHQADEVYHGPHLASGVMHNDWTARPWPYDEDLHLTNWTVTQARRFLRRRDPSCPFFLTVSFVAPHPPLMPPSFYFDRYLRIDLPEPAIGLWAKRPWETPRSAGDAILLEGETRRSCLAGYYGSINHIDDQIRRVIYPLHGIEGFDLDNTVVVFTSDHGEMLGDHHCWTKSRPYEGSARIPLIIKAPRRFGLSAGSLIDKPVCLEDIMPTLLDLAEVPIPAKVDGRSMLPLLRGEDVVWRDALHLEHSTVRKLSGFHALTDGNEKYIWFSNTGREQLFDLTTDPREFNDLASDPTMTPRLAAWREKLIKQLHNRPEGFVTNGNLQSISSHEPIMEHARQQR